jgi:hypothetical protein
MTNESVLAVDDDEDVRLVLGDVLDGIFERTHVGA